MAERTESGAPLSDTDLPGKIARLVEERGWNQEDFARSARLNRHTIRLILKSDGTRRLRNATVSQCANALGITVNALRTLPLERLLPRMHGRSPEESEPLTDLLDRTRSQEVIAWAKRNPERATRFTQAEVEEILSLQGPDGPLERIGVEHVVELIERKRIVKSRIDEIARTEYLGLLEQMVELVYDKAGGTED